MGLDLGFAYWQKLLQASIFSPENGNNNTIGYLWISAIAESFFITKQYRDTAQILENMHGAGKGKITCNGASWE